MTSPIGRGEAHSFLTQKRKQQRKSTLDKNVKILIVDDFTTMRRIEKNLFKGLGFNNFDEADSAETALNMLRDGSFGLLVVEQNLPGMSGIDLLRSVRAEESISALPVLLVIEGSKATIMEAMQAGVNGYIVKPFTGPQLQDTLEKMSL
jgi:two-component system chemotaxis response regulator CheY